MAIYHFSGNIISRGQGQSAVASAAYRSGEALSDARYEKIQDYSRKTDVVFSEILLPAEAPPWMSEREKLWNAVEAFEKRKDAQLARDFNFALPKELSLEQNIALARSFVQKHFIEKGMIGDLCVHVDETEQGSLAHAHLMLTMRSVGPEGFGPKVRAWNEKAQLLAWREAWAESANRALALEGHDIAIDHRTLEAQEINLEPQHKIGAKAANARMARFADHQRIARENGERLFEKPEIALKALSQQQSTFSHQDIARFVNRHSVDAEQFERVYEKVKQHPEIVRLGLDAQNRERFSTREMLGLERQLLEDAQHLAQQSSYAVDVSERIQEASMSTRTLSEQQQAALVHLSARSHFSCLIGYAGSGKSYVLGAAREAWEAAGYRVQGVTLAGIAAEGLEAKSGIETRTLASRCYYWDRGERLKARDILVVDEAGMLGSRQLGRILSEARQGGAKVVLVGDAYQLQAIEAGAPFRALTERFQTLELNEIRRQKIPWQAEATKLLGSGAVSQALEAYAAHQQIYGFATLALARAGLMEAWNRARLANPEQSQILLAYTRADVQALNTEARAIRKSLGELGTEHSLKTERGERCFAAQDRVYFLRNERSLGVMNGSLGTVERIEGTVLNIRLDPIGSASSRSIQIDLQQYPYLDHGYATTIHKSQGVTVDRSYLLGSRYWDAHASYVAMSRHQQSAELFYSREEFPRFQDLSRVLSRERRKDISLDYSAEYGRYRGIEPEVQAVEVPPYTRQSSFRERFEAQYPERARALKAKTFARQDLARGSSFSAQFEARHPERAAQLDAAISPSFEREAQRIEKVFQNLEKNILAGHASENYRETLRIEARSASQNTAVMEYLKGHNKELFNKVEALNKMVEQARHRDIQRSLELER